MKDLRSNNVRSTLTQLQLHFNSPYLLTHYMGCLRSGRNFFNEIFSFNFVDFSRTVGIETGLPIRLLTKFILLLLDKDAQLQGQPRTDVSESCRRCPHDCI